jgi:aspartate racemase
MRTIGLIGGLSWYSTADYYRIINEQVRTRLGGHASAKIALQSLDFSEVRELQKAEDWAGAGRLLSAAGRRCQDAGAEIVLICSNLMHKVTDDVAEALDVPLLHIGDAIAARARTQGWSRLGLIGSRWVMEETFYAGRLGDHGLDVLLPGEDDRALVNKVIFDELTQGRIVPESRAEYVRIIEKLGADGADAVVLGCTEIELLVRPKDASLPLLESARVHAEAAVEFALSR